MIIEMVEQLGRVPDVVVVPVGGGGLLAGCVAWLRERHPSVRLVGVEPAGAAEVAAGLAAGRPVDLVDLDTFVDGAAVRRAGAVTLPIIAASAAEMITAPEGQVCVEMLDYYQSDGIVLEPAGALATAGLDELFRRGLLTPGSTVVCAVRRQQRRQPVCGGGRACSRARGPQALLRGRVPAGAWVAAAVPGRGARARGRHRAVRVREEVNQETGPAIVGLELARAEDLPGLLERMAASPVKCEQIDASSPMFRLVV